MSRTERVQCDRCRRVIPSDETRTVIERTIEGRYGQQQGALTWDLCANCDILVVSEIRFGHDRPPR